MLQKNDEDGENRKKFRHSFDCIIIIFYSNKYTKFMKKVVSIFLCFAWLVSVFAAILLLVKTDDKPSYDAVKILEVWQIDMCEGGKGSRRQYLSNVAEKFEKNHDNVLVTVINQTVESAETNFQKGVYPDLISYSQGVSGLKSIVEPIETNGKYLGAVSGGKIYAVPWASGGYVYFKREENSEVNKIYLSKGDYNFPVVAAFLEGFDVNICVELPPEEAFNEFLNNKNSALIGTQRDLFRAKSKNLSFIVTALNKFTDIVQYISIIGSNEKSRILSNTFIDFLVEESGDLPEKLGMLPQQKNAKTNDNGLIGGLVDVKNAYVTAPFAEKTALYELNHLIFDKKIDGDKKMKYVKNAVIYLK